MSEKVSNRVTAEEWALRVDLDGNKVPDSPHDLIEVPKPIVDGITVQVEQVTRGLGGDLVWPALLRKLDRQDSSFRD